MSVPTRTPVTARTPVTRGDDAPAAASQSSAHDAGEDGAPSASRAVALRERARALPLASRVAVVVGAAAVLAAFNALVIPFLLPNRRALGRVPWVPSDRAAFRKALAVPLRHLPPAPPLPRFVDLGSGDGRAVIDAARAGLSAEGIEMNPWLLWVSRMRARRARLHGHGADAVRAVFRRGDFWHADLSRADVVFFYGLNDDAVMLRFRDKVLHEMRAGRTWVISSVYPVPTWTPEDSVSSRRTPMWVYRVPGESHQHRQR